MLILTRKRGERILIGESITITITDIQDDRVELGFDAPKEIEIFRAEVKERKHNVQTMPTRRIAGV